MNPVKMQLNPKTIKRIAVTIVVSFVFLTTIVTLYMLEYNRKEILRNTENTLNTVLREIAEGLRVWHQDKKDFLEYLEDDDVIIEKVEELLLLQPVDSVLLKSQFQYQLRDLFIKRNELFGNSDFCIIDKKHITIVSSVDSLVGKESHLSKCSPEYLRRVFEDEVVFIPPHNGNCKNTLHKHEPQMYFAAPLKNKKREIIACIIRNVIIKKDFAKIVSAGQIGNTGETYAFNKDALFISSSRFREELVTKGLIESKNDDFFNIRIVDNSVPEKPLTLMSKSAINGEDGHNFEGYNDYRGETVLGVWQWIDDLEIGIATEIDKSEVMGAFNLLKRTVFITLFIIISIAAIGLSFVLILSENAFKTLKEAQFDLENKVKQRTNALNKSQEILRTALTKAEAATKAKSSFLANMSHEIRTPMNAIMGFSDLLVKTPLNETQKKYSKTINHSATMLLVILNDILDLAKMEEGKLSLEKAPFSLNSLVHNVLDIYKLQAKKKRLTLSSEISPQLGNWFEGDMTRLHQILSNLLANAIKFTHKGSVQIEVKKDAKRDFLKFFIKDTGVGIPKESLKKIFQPFKQADDSTTRKYGGTGLGTSISRQLVELMEGEISVESTVGEGSVFMFTALLPEVEKPDTAELNVFDDTTFEKPSKSLKILLAEDIPENAELIEINMHNIGHSITSVSNGIEVVEERANGKSEYDVILMDIHMPKMDGLEATKKIREYEKENQISPIPIIALSASVLAEERHLCFDSGMDGFVSKPVKFTELFSEMNRLTDSTVIAEVITNQNANTNMPLIDEIDVETGLQNWMGKENFMKNLDSFVLSHKEDVTLIRNCIEGNDIEKAKELCHALKGVSSNLCLTTVSKIVIELEVALKKGDEKTGSLLEKLEEAFYKTIKEISHFTQTSATDVQVSGKVLETEELHNMIENLQKALYSDNPDEIEPILEKLQENLDNPMIFEITDAVNQFEFREAEEILKKLSISMGFESQEDEDE